MRWSGLAPLAIGCLMTVAHPAGAFVSQAERVAAAAAAANVASSRTQALRLELLMRIGEGEPVARGELITHPTGLARLELRGSGGLVERHLLRGTEHSATRNGRAQRRPRAFLPPLFLLQADSAETLRAALGSFGILVESIGLAPCGEHDCYVVGDPSRVVPPSPASYGPAESGEFAAADAERVEPAPVAARVSGENLPRIWIDVASFELLRIDAADGIRVRVGPPASFDAVRFPAWLEIEEPNREKVRFDILRATPVNAPPPAFSEAWLFSSEQDEPGPASEGADLSN